MFLIVSPKTWQSIWIVFECAIDKKRIKLKKLYFHSSNHNLRCVNKRHEYWCWYWWGSTNFWIVHSKNLIAKYAPNLNISFAISFLFYAIKFRIDFDTWINRYIIIVRYKHKPSELQSAILARRKVRMQIKSISF